MKHGKEHMNNYSGKIKNFTDLNAWIIGHKLVLLIYRITKNFPRDEQFGLITQLRRAAVSITSNIAEGFSRNSYKEKSQFYSMALGSLTEVENQILISKDLGYISQEATEELTEIILTVNKLLNGLIKKSRTMIHNS